MAFIIKDTHPQFEGQEAYMVGTRHIKDPQGRDCEAADFGSRERAKRFPNESEARAVTYALNKIARHEQFVVEEDNIYAMRYGQRKNNGFSGFGTLSKEEPAAAQTGGFVWKQAKGGYNGF